MPSFREAVLATGNTPTPMGGIFGFGGHRGSAPTPFDAVDFARLAGPEGSHPLAAITIEELLAGKLPDIPPTHATFQRAERIAAPGQQQASLFGTGTE